MQFLRHVPLKCRDVEAALRNLGFAPEDKGGTSHVHWVCVRDGRMYKVTVDCHRGEVRANDVKSIINQAGVSKRQFLAALNRS
jgi:hypothetical protein